MTNEEQKSLNPAPKIRPDKLTPEAKQKMQAFAVELYHAKRLRPRQLEVWLRRLEGKTVDEMVTSKTISGSERTLYRDLQSAKAVIEEEFLKQQEGTVRMGKTADTGHEPQWKTDKTMQGIQPDQETNYPLPALELYGKKGCVR